MMSKKNKIIASISYVTLGIMVFTIIYDCIKVHHNKMKLEEIKDELKWEHNKARAKRVEKEYMDYIHNFSSKE